MACIWKCITYKKTDVPLMVSRQQQRKHAWEYSWLVVIQNSYHMDARHTHSTEFIRCVTHRPLADVENTATPGSGQQRPRSPAKGTPMQAWRAKHPRRAAAVARAALKGCEGAVTRARGSLMTVTEHQSTW